METKDTITQYNIGLQNQEQNREIKPLNVIKHIKKHVKAGTFKETKGLWMNELEDSLEFECVNIEEHFKQESPFKTAEDLKKNLEKAFNQDSVLMKQFEAGAKF
jgi:hypothetical protein